MPDVLGLNPLEDYMNCPACGAEMCEQHAKWVCTKCSYKRGCCDLL